MSKPTVSYGHLVSCRVGESAVLVSVSGHPNHVPGQKVSNTPGRFVTTSRVIAFDPESGRIETENTIYQREST